MLQLTTPVQFENKAPENNEWSAHIRLLNEWTAPELQLRHIVGYIRSGAHFPKDMHVDLIEQYVEANEEYLVGHDEPVSSDSPRTSEDGFSESDSDVKAKDLYLVRRATRNVFRYQLRKRIKS